MGRQTNISYTDSTWNPWMGCAKVSPGCAYCYAETLMDTRYGRVKWGKGQSRSRTSAANWKKPRQWNKAAEGAKERPRVFCASLADWLDDEVPIQWLADLLELIQTTPNLDWLLLSKRPQNWRPRLEAVLDTLSGETGNPPCGFGHPMFNTRCMVNAWLCGPRTLQIPANVWIGTTVEDQQRADERIPLLLDIPAKIRFLSCEPLIGPVNLDVRVMRGTTFTVGDEGGYEYVGSKRQMLSWVVCGTESGPNARPMKTEWAQVLRDQCAMERVPFFMKQMMIDGKLAHDLKDMPEDLRIREFPHNV